MKSIVPSNITVVEVNLCNATNSHFNNEENTALGLVSDKRFKEFNFGRECAHKALKKQGVIKESPILIGKSKEPLWPENFIGSITHSNNYCAAAVAKKDEILCLGIDAEWIVTLSSEIVKLIALGKEIEFINQYPKNPFDVLLFSAKESVYKAVFPLARQWFGFEDIHIDFDIKKETFKVTKLDHVSSRFDYLFEQLVGNYTISEDYVKTSVYVVKS